MLRTVHSAISFNRYALKGCRFNYISQTTTNPNPYNNIIQSMPLLLPSYFPD